MKQDPNHGPMNHSLTAESEAQIIVGIDKVSHRRDREHAEREVESGVYQIDGMESVRIVIDVGAYHGSFARHVKKLYPAAYVHCFEPDSRNYMRLVSSTKHLSRVYFHAAAMAGAGGMMKFKEGALPSCSTLDNHLKPCRGVDEVTEVFCRTLPDFMRATISNRLDVDILKLDCEGAEAEILEACSEADLRRLRYITGEWHGDAIRDRALWVLIETHTVEFTTLKPGRGYFYAKRR